MKVVETNFKNPSAMLTANFDSWRERESTEDSVPAARRCNRNFAEDA